MKERNGDFRAGAWRKFRAARGLHLIHVPPKVCAFCGARTHAPSRDEWRQQVVQTAGLKVPLIAFCCPSCYRAQGSARRKLAADAEPVIQHGLPFRPRRCPKCDVLLDQEPGYARCRWGCGKLWPIRGASLVQQLEFERRSGLLLIA